MISGAVGSFYVVTVAGLWYFLNGQAKHWKAVRETDSKIWKELCKEKENECNSVRKENEEIKADPRVWADRYITASEAVYSQQITKLKAKLDTLKSEIDEKKARIRNLTEDTKAKEDDLEFQREMRQKLERKIAAYEEVIDGLVRRRDLAARVVEELRSDTCVAVNIEANTQDEVTRRITEIDATSFTKSWARQGVGATARAMANTRKFQEELRRREIADKQAEQIHLRAELNLPSPLKTSDDHSRRKTNPPKRG